MVLKDASLRARDSLGGCGCGVRVVAKFNRWQPKFSGCAGDLLVFVAGGFCPAPASLFTKTCFNDQRVIGHLGQTNAQGFRISAMGNLN